MGAAEGQLLEEVQDLAGVGEVEPTLAVVRDIDQVVRGEGVGAVGADLGVVAAQAEDDAGFQVGPPRAGCRTGRRSGHGEGARGHGLQDLGVLLEILREVHAEVVQRHVRDGDAAAEILHVDHLVLELLELAASVLQVVHLTGIRGLDDVLLAGRGDVEQDHAAGDAGLQVDVLVQLHVGPEVDQLDDAVARAESVDAAEALDDAHRVPVDVVVDQVVAVLEVLALGDAVGGDQEVDLGGLGRVDLSSPLLRDRRRRRSGSRRGPGGVLGSVVRLPPVRPVTMAECRPSSSSAQSAMLR